MNRIKSALPWVLLWMGFVVFGLWIRTIIPWHRDIAWFLHNVRYSWVIEYNGYDYTRYGQMLSHFSMVFYAAFRHPFYGVIMSPVIFVAARLHELGDWPMWCFFIAFFSAVMTGASYLVAHLSRRLVAGILFASFASTWTLAATPESFGLSCLIALVVLWWAQRPKGPESVAGWCTLTVLAGGITSTQAVKVAIAYLVTNKITKRLLLVIGGLLVCAGLVVVGYFTLRVLLRHGNFLDPWHNFATYLVGGKKSFSAHLGEIWVFFSEPIVTRGERLSANVLSWQYPDLVRPLIAASVLIAAGVSAWVARRELLTKLLGAMFLVDVLIHFVFYWGMEEAQLYAGHWVYALPILIALGLSKLPPRHQRLATLLIYLQATAVFAANVLAWCSLSA